MPDLSSNNQKILLEIARSALKTFLSTGDHEDISNRALDPELLENRGCFVALMKAGKLRGCVGTFDDSQSLVQNTARMAPAAATQDNRFSRVTKDELPEIKINISVLGPLGLVQDLDEIEIGKHGVLVKYKDRKGTFLPEVAVEHKWSVPEFVTFCAREKAGLAPEECGKAEIYKYEVQKIGE